MNRGSVAVRLILIAAVSIGVALAAFAATSHQERANYLALFCEGDMRNFRYPWTDPWTGEAHGLSYECTATVGGESWLAHELEPAPELAERFIITLPAGLAAGAVLAIAGIAVFDLRRHRSYRRTGLPT